MKFTLGEIRWMQKGLAAITQMQLPIRISYKLAKLFNFCNNEVVIIEQTRSNLIKSLAVEDPNKPGEFKVDPENEEKFKEEIEKLISTEVEFDFEPISLKELGDDIKITPLNLASLTKVIIDE